MRERNIKVKITAHAFNAFMERAGIHDIDSAIDSLRKNLPHGNLVESKNGAYLNLPLIGAQMALARENGHYVAKTFYKTFGTGRGENVNVEYVY
jgi:hypothetical protein